MQKSAPKCFSFFFSIYYRKASTACFTKPSSVIEKLKSLLEIRATCNGISTRLKFLLFSFEIEFLAVEWMFYKNTCLFFGNGKKRENSFTRKKPGKAFHCFPHNWLILSLIVAQNSTCCWNRLFCFMVEGTWNSTFNYSLFIKDSITQSDRKKGIFFYFKTWKLRKAQFGRAFTRRC